MSLLINLLLVFFAVLSIYCLVLELYAVFISFFGFAKARKTYKKHSPKTRFLILVASHNEEDVIGGTLDNLSEIDYPRHLYDLIIVNDNSTDKTDLICDEKGVRHIDTIEKKFPKEGVGKSAGLQYALRHLGFEKLKDKYDLLLVLDADNHVDSNILSEINSQWIHEKSPHAIQVYLDSKNASSLMATGYAISYNFTNRFFQLAKKRLGLNNAIGGTGFAVRVDWLIDTGGFCYKSLVEDLEMSIEIFKAGGNVSWNHFTRIYDEKPDTLKISIRQRIRWCQGHWYVAFTNFKPLVKGFVKSKFDMRYLDQLSYLFSMGRALALFILLSSMTIVAFYSFFSGSFTGAFAEIIDVLVIYIVPLNIFRIMLFTYGCIFLPIYGNYVDGSEKVHPIKNIVSILYVGITYIYAQIVGLFKWRQQNVWVKTPHVYKHKMTEKQNVSA